MDYVALCVLLREVEEVYGTCRVRDVYYDVADLAEAVGSLVQAEKLGDHGGGLGAELSWRDVCRKGRVVGVVLEEWAEEMDVEELEEHAAKL